MSLRQSGLELASWVAQLLDKKNGRGIFVYDVRKISSIAEYMIIVTGTSTKHIETLVETPVLELKKLGHPVRFVEGKGTAWVVADMGDVVLHVFDEAARQQFNLEKLYDKAPRVDWETKPHLAPVHASHRAS